MPKRPDLTNIDRFLFVWSYHWFPSVLAAIVGPETIIRSHRIGTSDRATVLEDRGSGTPSLGMGLADPVAHTSADEVFGTDNAPVQDACELLIEA
jgi:hypothetical protein